MRRSVHIFLTLAALCLVARIHGDGQTPSNASGVVVDFVALPPIDLGLLRSLSRSPDSPESRIRASLRPEGFTRDRVGSGGAHYIAGKVIVKFKSGSSTASRASTMSLAKAKAATQPSYANFDVLDVDLNDDAEATARTLAARDDVEYAQAAYRVHTEMVPNDPLYNLQWNLRDIDLERAWDIQPAAGSQITVAVLDTGVAHRNVRMQYRASAFRIDSDGFVEPPNGSGTLYPALGTLTLDFVAATDLGPSSRFVSPHDFIWDSDLPLDLDGHGTHVSGTIGQTTNNNSGTAGVAFNVKLMPVKVIDSNWDDIFGSPNFATDDVVARGIRYAADNGAKVINMSIGRSGPRAPVVEDAVNYAIGKGAFIAVAGGNDFEDGNPTEVFGEIASRVAGCVSVAAVDRAHDRAFYSSSGSWIELAAPGGSFRGFGDKGGILQQTLDLKNVETYIPSPATFTAPRFDTLAHYYFIGTSQATPHVSGLAAMLMQQGITSPAAVEAALEKFATDRGAAGRDNDFGFGEINARNTLRGLGLTR